MPSIAPPEMRGDAVLHFARGLVGEGDGEDLARPGLAGGDEMGEPRGQRGGLAGAGAGEHQHRAFGRKHRLALGRIEALQIGGIGVWKQAIQALGEVGRGERNGNRSGLELQRDCGKVPQLFPISPLSTGLSPYFSLLRLGSDVHGARVIGADSPSLPGRPATARRVRKVTKEPISAGRQWEELSGSFPGPVGKRRRKRKSSCRATRLPGLLVGSSVSKAGRKRVSQEGPWNIGRFWPGASVSPRPGRTSERPANLRAAQSSRSVGFSRRELLDGKRRLSW